MQAVCLCCLSSTVIYSELLALLNAILFIENIMCGVCRPAAKDILLHPFFWSAGKRHSFLLKASDRVEHEDRADDSVVLRALEAIGPNVFGASWESKLDSKLLEDGRRYRKYNFSSVRDLLRIIRNKSHHFMELPPDMQVRGPDTVI